MNNDTIIKIVLADDQAIIRQGLKYIINTQPDMKVVGEAADGEEAAIVTQHTMPDIVLMDIQMPKCTGIEATRTIQNTMPNVKVILLTTFDVQDYVFDGIRAGAVGYLLKDTDTLELFDSIRSAHEGHAIYRTATASKAIGQMITRSHTPHETHLNLSDPLADQLPGLLTSPLTDQFPDHLADPLTDREIDVLQQMAYGKRNSEIAKILFVSEGTVKTHVHRILQKLNVEDRTQAVVIAIRQGIVD